MTEEEAPPLARSVLGVLRSGMLLGLGWVACAALAWEMFGVLWAGLVLVLWVLLLRRFHGTVETLARSVARRSTPPGT